jgi:hypothetical protein
MFCKITIGCEVSGKRRGENGLLDRKGISRGFVSSASVSYSGYTGLVCDFLQENSEAVPYNLPQLLYLAQLSKFIIQNLSANRYSEQSALHKRRR